MRGVEASGHGADSIEILLQPAELRDLDADLRPPTVDELSNVAAGSSSAVSDRDHLADLGEGQANGLRGVDERQAGQRVWVEGAVPGFGAARRCDEADLLVVAEGGSRDAARAG